MACTRLDSGLVIVVHGRGPPTDSAWDAFLAFMESWAREQNELPRHIAFSLGGGPTAAQSLRAVARARCVHAPPTRRVLLSSSRPARLIARATSYFGRDLGPVRSFEWDDVEKALVWLGVSMSPELVRQERQRLLCAVG